MSSTCETKESEPEEITVTPTPPKPATNRRFFRAPSNPWVPYIGDCKALESYLNSKNGIAWLPLKYINALLRGISQVTFANNPLSGLIILTALLWANVFVGLAATVAATTAILTAASMRQDPGSIAAGLTTYNAVLVGTITTSLWTPLYGEDLGVKLWIFIILGSALSVFVTSAFSNILSSLKTPLPATTLPFNVVIILLFLCLMPKNIVQNENVGEPTALRLIDAHHNNFTHVNLPQSHTKDDGVSSSKAGFQPKNFSTVPSRISRAAEDVSNTSSTDFGVADNGNGHNQKELLNWGKILNGVILSTGQLFGVQDEISSVFIYIAVLIYSPILCMMSVFGAILGTVFGIVLAAAPYEAVYNGLWGYNGILSAASVGGFFIVLTCHSFWNATANVILTALLQQAFLIAFSPIKLPIFTLPFALSTFLFLSVTTAGNHLPRVETITFPEMHRYLYRESGRVKREQRLKQKASIVADEIAEEKEFVLTDVKVINEEEEVKVDLETAVDTSTESENKGK